MAGPSLEWLCPQAQKKDARNYTCVESLKGGSVWLNDREVMRLSKGSDTIEEEIEGASRAL